VSRRPVLIDTDPGIDDALALLLALTAPEWRVEALTTVAGNVPVPLGTSNVARILDAVGRARMPRVGVGAARPPARALVTATHAHGPDGLGGTTALRRPDGSPRFPEARLVCHPRGAADLIVSRARRWPGALVIVALGPLTNLAAAIRRDREALRRVAGVVVMGGAVSVPGNVTPGAEFNVFVDPESAASVFGAGLPLTLVPLDVTGQVVWSGTAIDRLGRVGTRLTAFAHSLGRAALGLARAAGEPGVTLHDPLAVGVALDPTLVETASLPLAVETDGCLTRGMTLGDRRPGARWRTDWPSCRVALRVDARRFLRLFEDRLCRASA
jgi:inosine-uridine nucleoside N-ribohydrolase